MTMTGPYLCETCPGKGNAAVDFDVIGSCPIGTADSFKQARRFWLQASDDYDNDIEILAASVANGLIYYDYEADDNYFWEGDYMSARLGGLCAQQFMAGDCPKTRCEIDVESDTD